MNSLVYGDVFVYGGLEYIFLASTPETIYCAKILDREITQKIKNSYDNAIKKNKEVALRNVLYCFVILTTEEVENRMASLANTDGNHFDREIKKLDMVLNDDDRSNLKDEILSSRGVPLVLKELITGIE